jgi:hypothetical protein
MATVDDHIWTMKEIAGLLDREGLLGKKRPSSNDSSCD